MTSKENLSQNWSEFIFFCSGKYLIDYQSDTNPCQYRVAFLQGSNLRNDDIVKSFGKRIKWKVYKCNKDVVEWPLSPKQLIQ